jgi:hypothetical protein
MVSRAGRLAAGQCPPRYRHKYTLGIIVASIALRPSHCHVGVCGCGGYTGETTLSADASPSSNMLALSSARDSLPCPDGSLSASGGPSGRRCAWKPSSRASTVLTWCVVTRTPPAPELPCDPARWMSACRVSTKRTAFVVPASVSTMMRALGRAPRTGARVTDACQHVESKGNLEAHEHSDTTYHDRNRDDGEYCRQSPSAVRSLRQQPTRPHTDWVPHQLARDLYDMICDRLGSPRSPGGRRYPWAKWIRTGKQGAALSGVYKISREFEVDKTCALNE